MRMAQDPLASALQAYSVVDNSFRQKRQDEENTRRWNEEMALRRDQAAQQSALNAEALKGHQLQNQQLQRTVDQQQDLDDVNYTVGQIKDLVAAYQEDPDVYNERVGKLWDDKLFQKTIKAHPELSRMIDGADKNAQAYNDFGQTLAEITETHEQNPDFKVVGDHQEMGGATAQKLFDSLNQMEGGQRFPYDVVPGSVKFVSPVGGDKWALQFQYKNQDGQIVNGVATQNRTMSGAPGSAQDPVVMKSIPELFQESQSKMVSNLALAGLKARAATGADASAKALTDRMDAEDITKGRNTEAAKALIPQLSALVGNDPYSKQQFGLLTAAASTGSIDIPALTTSALNIAGNALKSAQNEQEASAALSATIQAAKASGNKRMITMATAFEKDMLLHPEKFRTKEGALKAYHEVEATWGKAEDVRLKEEQISIERAKVAEARAARKAAGSKMPEITVTDGQRRAAQDYVANYFMPKGSPAAKEYDRQYGGTIKNWAGKQPSRYEFLVSQPAFQSLGNPAFVDSIVTGNELARRSGRAVSPELVLKAAAQQSGTKIPNYYPAALKK